MSEVDFIAEAKTGSLDAFNHLVLTYQDLAYNQAYYLLGEHSAAEDAVQEAFLSAYRGLGGFRGGSFRAWLLRIVTNICLDLLRYDKKHPAVPLEQRDVNDEEIESAAWMIDPAPSPEQALERSELRRVIERSLGDLPPNSRAAVVLVDILEMDYVEAAAAMGVPLGTLKSRLVRARQRLADRLREALGEIELQAAIPQT